MKATATLRYMKGSAQKVRLVADLVRGKTVNEAVAILRYTPKVAAKAPAEAAEVGDRQRRAEAGATRRGRSGRARKIIVDKGPQEKRVRPAPMGRAYRVLQRKSHVTIEISDEA